MPNQATIMQFLFQTLRRAHTDLVLDLSHIICRVNSQGPVSNMMDFSVLVESRPAYLLLGAPAFSAALAVAM